jgi:hypothetical protein
MNDYGLWGILSQLVPLFSVYHLSKLVLPCEFGVPAGKFRYVCAHDSRCLQCVLITRHAQVYFSMQASFAVIHCVLQAVHFGCVVAAASVVASEIPGFGIITTAVGESFVPLLELGVVLVAILGLVGGLFSLISTGRERLTAPGHNMSYMLHGLFISMQLASQALPA